MTSGQPSIVPSSAGQVNFVDLTQKMALLKEMHTEAVQSENDDNWDRRERYIALRREVAGILVPLFHDLENMDMIMYVLFGGTEAHQNMANCMPIDDNSATMGNLGDACVNGGIQLCLKD